MQRRRSAAAVVMMLGLGLTLAGCAGEDSRPIDPSLHQATVEVAGMT